MLLICLVVIAAEQTFNVLPLPLEEPPFEYTLSDSSAASEPVSLPYIELVTQTESSPTGIDEWFDTLPGSWPSAQFHEGGLNSHIIRDTPPEGVNRYIIVPGGEFLYLDKLINSNHTVLALYGEPPNRFNVVLNSQIMLIMKPGTFEVVRALDFLSYSRYHSSELDPAEEEFTFQRVMWAEVEDGILYVCTTHQTYAYSSAGKNAYITAIDLEDLQLLWRTEPLVCNSQNFILSENVIFCGYGFTAEDDHVYILNKFTGEIIQSVPVPSAPEYFLLDNDLLYILCYDAQLVFKVIPCPAESIAR